MGNYFNKMRWKNIRATIFFDLYTNSPKNIRFWKSLVQERFKSNLEFRYQINFHLLQLFTIKVICLLYNLQRFQINLPYPLIAANML